MLTKMFEDTDIHKLNTYISKGSRFVIVAHMSPDGDAIGSSLALYHYLLNIGKESVNVIMPNDFPLFLKWMPAAKEIIIYDKYQEYADELIAAADVIFCLDFNEPKRVGAMSSALVASEGRKVMIDHHLYPSDFCQLVFSFPEISSTSEMIFRLICALKSYDDINKPMAQCIYVGMMTDTGAFTYNSNTVALYVIIAELIKKGIDKDEIYRKVYQVSSESRLRLMGFLLHEKMKIYPEEKTALITLTKEELDRFQHQPGDTEGFVNLPLSIEGVLFSIFIREDKEYTKLSFRSVGDFPCNKFASTYFNGGGHKNASGGEFYGPFPDAVARFEKGLKLFNPQNYTSSDQEEQ